MSNALKINHLIDALEIENLDPSRFPKIVADTWGKLRFADPVLGLQTYSASDAIGAKLLATDNWAWIASGWFDSSVITFPADQQPVTSDEILFRLERMLDCRQNDEVLQYLWQALFKQTKRKFEAKNSVAWRTSINDVALGLDGMQHREPRLFKALMAGQLSEVRRFADDNPRIQSNKERYNTVCWMCAVWALFDLQVIAYRLFHAEWNGLEAGLESPEACTLESLEAIATDVSKLVSESKAAFENGLRTEDLSQDLQNLIATNNLLGKAKAIAGASGEKQHERGFIELQKEVELYFKYIEEKFGEVFQFFDKRRRRPRTNLLGYAHIANDKRRGHVPDTVIKHNGKSYEIKHDVATTRFSIPAVAGLYYAVDRIVDDLHELPKLLDSRAKPFFASKRSVKEALFTVLRDLFVRPAKNGSDYVVGEREYFGILGPEAERLKEITGMDDGLEPMRPTWREEPDMPFRQGVSAGNLLSDGKDLGREDVDHKDPRIWEAKRPRATHTSNVRALKNLRERPEGKKAHFVQRAAKLDDDFGSAVRNRLRMDCLDENEGEG